MNSVPNLYVTSHCAELSSGWCYEPFYEATTPHTQWPGRNGGQTFFYWSGMSVKGMEYQPLYDLCGNAKQLSSRKRKKREKSPRFFTLPEEFRIRARAAIAKSGRTL